MSLTEREPSKASPDASETTHNLGSMKRVVDLSARDITNVLLGLATEPGVRNAPLRCGYAAMLRSSPAANSGMDAPQRSQRREKRARLDATMPCNARRSIQEASGACAGHAGGSASAGSRTTRAGRCARLQVVWLDYFCRLPRGQPSGQVVRRRGPSITRRGRRNCCLGLAGLRRGSCTPRG